MCTHMHSDMWYVGRAITSSLTLPKCCHIVSFMKYYHAWVWRKDVPICVCVLALQCACSSTLIFSLFVFWCKPSVWDSFCVCLFTPPFSFCVCGYLCMSMSMGMHTNVFMFVWVCLPAVKLVISEVLNKMLPEIAFGRSGRPGNSWCTDHCSALCKLYVTLFWFHRFPVDIEYKKVLLSHKYLLTHRIFFELAYWQTVGLQSDRSCKVF